MGSVCSYGEQTRVCPFLSVPTTGARARAGAGCCGGSRAWAAATACTGPARHGRWERAAVTQRADTARSRSAGSALGSGQIWDGGGRSFLSLPARLFNQGRLRIAQRALRMLFVARARRHSFLARPVPAPVSMPPRGR